MCLLVCAWGLLPEAPLVVLANRDEFYARPTAPLSDWGDGVLAGRDLLGGGTWLGVRGRRFAALTNIRDPARPTPEGAPSRGELVLRALRGEASARELLAPLCGEEGRRYAGFNLLASDGQELVWVSNSAPEPRVLSAGVYGLSNHLLDTPWPKLVRLRAAFSEAIRGEDPLADPVALLDLLVDRRRPPDAALPDTGVGLELERLLSSVFIAGEAYGTRSSTLVVARSSRVDLWERTHDGARGRALGAPETLHLARALE